MIPSALKVLVVDDDPAILDYLRRLCLRQPDVEIATTTCLVEALASLEQAPADVILLDLALPESRGIGTLERILTRSGEAAIVVLTGTEDDRLAAEAFARGAQDWLVKGQIHPSALVRILRFARIHKQSRDCLAEMAATFESILDRLPVGVGRVSGQGQLRYTNPALRAALELPELQVSLTFPGSLPEDLGTCLGDALRRVQASGVPVRLDQVVHQPHDAPHKVLSAWLAPLSRPGAEPETLVLVEDVTTARDALEALKESELRFRTAAQIATDIIYERDLTTENATFYGDIDGIHGYDPGEYPRQLAPWWDIVHPDDMEALQRDLWSGLQARRMDLRYRIRRKDGGWESWHDKGAVLTDSRGNPTRVIGAATNVTVSERLKAERAQVEAHLWQQQRLESIGTIARGVAHEINNPVNVVLNYAQILAEDSSLPTSARGQAQEIVEAAESVAHTVHNLLRFAEPQGVSFLPASSRDLVMDLLGVFSSLIEKDHILLEVDVPADLPPVRCRGPQVQQVLLNLVLNAQEALNDRYPGPHPDKRLRIEAREEPGARVRLTVQDAGPGVPPSVAHRVFEPFFTTRSRSRHSGLGLSVSYGIAREHGATLTFDEAPGGGARFHLVLPTAVEGPRRQ